MIPALVSLEQIRTAARLIREGQLVAFPTETVYGLGANALDAAAVDRIFKAKGRPRGSPLIVHVSSIEMARGLVRVWPERACRLAERFWPGPLTLVLPKSASVPNCVTAGLDTVGIRMPNHRVAIDLIREAGVPIAAPSANRFSELSPTTAEHVREALGQRVALILDAGPAEIGIESTVISLVEAEAVLLRPGMISQAQLEAAIGPVRLHSDVLREAHPSPGMHPKHYSPRTPLILVDNGTLPAGHGAYLRMTGAPAGASRDVHMPSDPHAYAARLYDTLHRLDAENLDWIAVERPPVNASWAGIMDRLERASQR